MVLIPALPCNLLQAKLSHAIASADCAFRHDTWHSHRGPGWTAPWDSACVSRAQHRTGRTKYSGWFTSNPRSGQLAWSELIRRVFKQMPAFHSPMPRSWCN